MIVIGARLCGLLPYPIAHKPRLWIRFGLVIITVFLAV
jgi:hypothetical protein